ncbi:MAG TPA: hypothetical protein VIO64_04100 [Pseudobacteroides sp.]|uniref:hypothetical protein n=1 Tax=Pseudobacteroides sp. TaxID=1968840 RepID=UPI002F957765
MGSGVEPPLVSKAAPHFCKEKYHYPHMYHRNQFAVTGLLFSFYNAFFLCIGFAAFLFGHMVMYLRYVIKLSLKDGFVKVQ